MLTRKFVHFTFLTLSSILLLASCGKDKNIPDVSNIDVALDIVRYDKLMFEVDTNQIQNRAKQLVADYPTFSEIYTSPKVMRAKEWKDSSEAAVIAHVMRGKQMKMLYDTVNHEFKDFSSYEQALQQAFQFYKYYFPKQPIPKVFTCITEFGYQGFTYGPEILAIGLEHYLGSDFAAYGSIFPKYQTVSFTPKHLVASSMDLLVGELMSNTGKTPERNMLDAMIQEGKRLYILSLLMPYTPEHIILKYTPEQAQWCVDNEFEMWKFFVDEELIYNPNKRKYAKYISPTPTSPGMPQESPGRTGNWIGWKIVQKYMKQHPDKTVQDLLQEKDSKKILQTAKYKPRG